MELHVHTVGFYPADLFDRQQPDAMRTLDNDFVEDLPVWCEMTDSVLLVPAGLAEQPLDLRHQALGLTCPGMTDRPIQRGLEALVAEGFEEIVDRVRLERAQRILVVRGDEHHDGKIVGVASAEKRRGHGK